MPLVATRFDVIIDAGLAIVTTTRTFRNDEPSSIEATLTFPVPVHATLFGLQARIGDRVLTARAKRKEAARADYEAAIDRGKTAVLHEEVLRGVHMLSVGQVPPGVEVAVEFRWAMAATNIDGRCQLRGLGADFRDGLKEAQTLTKEFDGVAPQGRERVVAAPSTPAISSRPRGCCRPAEYESNPGGERRGCSK